MNRETTIQMAREVGFSVGIGSPALPKFTQLITLAVAKEAESRKAAQIENADLKERLARSGVDLRRAVAKEREECAKVCEGMHDEDRPTDYAWAIRARGEAV